MCGFNKWREKETKNEVCETVKTRKQYRTVKTKFAIWPQVT